MADRAENNKVPTRNAPNSDQEPQRSRGPDDRPTPPPRDEMNRKTAPGRDSAAPSSPHSAANRIKATESLFARTINDFRNKICQKRTCAVRQIAPRCECSGALPILVSYNKKSIRHPADAMSSLPIIKMSSSTPTILMRFPGIAPLGDRGHPLAIEGKISPCRS